MREKEKKPRKWMLILSSIVLYFALLILVSRARGGVALGMAPVIVLGATALLVGVLCWMRQRQKRSPLFKTRACILAFLGILYLPLLLAFISKMNHSLCDVTLLGYVDTAVRPEFSVDSFLDGAFQAEFSSWYESNLKPRGVFTKTYASIQYNCFNLKKDWIIGYNKDVFGPGYIYSELCINGYPDFSKQENWKKMKDYVDKLKILQEKLTQYGKYLYVYVAPSKADFHCENIPQKYKAVAKNDAINEMEAFAELMRQTDIPHMICSKEQYDSQYPAFYTSGIHWSRTYEQETSVQIIESLCHITGKNYRNIILGDVQESHIPFWRDADVYNLLNVWNKLDGHYFEYATARSNPDSYDKIGILLQGDSFAMGLRKDILDTYPYEDVFLVDRNQQYADRDNNYTRIESWDSIKIGDILDRIDVVAIETVVSELQYYSYGFVDYLINYLDTYKPGNGRRNYVQALDCSSEEAWQSDSINGVYQGEDGYAWGKAYCEIILEDSNLIDKGLELEIGVSPYVFYADGKADIVDIYINGKKKLSQSFGEAWDGSIYILPQSLTEAAEGDCYDIEIYCSKSFVLSQLGINDDNRDLAIMIRYVGSLR